MADFDSSEEEDGENVAPVEPFRIDWLNIPSLGLCQSVAISALPGCRFKEHKRNLIEDIEMISSQGITDVFILMVQSEFRRYRVPTIIQEYEKQGIFVHHHPVEDGCLPSDQDIMKMICTMQGLISEPSNRVLIHCYGGLGRSGTVAVCLLLSLDPNLTADTAIAFLRATRGARAIQTVRQWNFIQDFRRVEKDYYENEGLYEDRSRSVSR